jgi:hypothetical protein
MYETLETITMTRISNAWGNEVSIKREDGAVFTARKLNMNSAVSPVFIRDTRSETAPAHYAYGIAELRAKISAA